MTTTEFHPILFNGEPLVLADSPAPPEPEWPVFCGVCGRVTDHRGEHDDLVEAGRAYYNESGVWLLTACGRCASRGRWHTTPVRTSWGLQYLCEPCKDHVMATDI